MSTRAPECHPDRTHQARGLCRACYSKWRRSRDPEASRAYQREWAAKAVNRERKRASEKARREADPDAGRARVLAWRCANRDRFNAGAAALRARDPEKYRAQKRASEQKRRASRRTCVANAPTASELSDLTAPGVLCFYCDSAPATSVDHFIPLARGGAHEMQF
jgi:5-methylcytosine-specific restriction endonuclease McrA